MAEFEIEGSRFIESAGPTLTRVRTILSRDRKHLAVVSVAQDSSHRVEIFRRATDPQSIGSHWAGIDCLSITDTLEDAERLAEEKLRDVTREH